LTRQDQNAPHGLTFHDSGFESTMRNTLLALGDSYTIGEGVAAGRNWPEQLVARLRLDGAKLDGPRIVATTGWTTDELASAMDAAALDPPYALATLSIGVNNQYRGRPVSSYIPEFEQLLKQAIQFAGNDTSHVIVLSIPDWGVTPFAKDRDQRQISTEINTYNAANRQMAQKYHVHYIDITPDSRQALTDHSLVAADGLHPSGREYAKWASQLAETIKKNL